MLRARYRREKFRTKWLAPRVRLFTVVRRLDCDEEDWDPDIGQPNERVEAVQGRPQS